MSPGAAGRVGSLGSKLPDPAWVNRNYRQQAGNRLQLSRPPCVHWTGWLPMPSLLKNSSGTGVCQQIARVGRAAWPTADLWLCPFLKLWDPVSGLSLCASLLYQAKCLFLALGLSSHTLPFKEPSAGSVASTHSNSLLIQRLQKKQITGASVLAISASIVSGLALFSIHPRVYPYYHQATIMKKIPLSPKCSVTV